MMRSIKAASLLACLLALLAACSHEEARKPDRANFTAALQHYLAERGHVCLGKYDWPITVSAGAEGADARQMKALEKLGLVGAKPADGAVPAASQPVSARAYELTARGQQAYLHVPVVIRTPLRTVTHPADLCAATLSLDRLVGWDPPRTREGRTATSLLFTYRIEPSAWASTPDALQAFPVLARAIEGEGAMQLRLGVHLTARGWIADELDEPSP